MYTIAMNDSGDLDFTNRHGRIITGKDKLVQQLSIWVQETYGVDRFHPTYGCHLQNMIGAPHTDKSLQDVQNELVRVATAYMNYQAVDFDRHPSDYSQDEVIAQVLYAQAYWYDRETIRCTLFVRTLAGNVEQLEYEAD